MVTLLELLLGAKRISGGKITYGAEIKTSTNNSTDVRIGILYQNPSSQILGASIKEELSTIVAGERRNQQIEFLELISSAFPYLVPERDPLELSYGQQKVLGLIGLMVGNYNLLLLDEPEQGLNEGHVAFLKQWLAFLREEQRATVIFTTHDLLLATTVADRIILMNQGHIAKEFTRTTVEELESSFKDVW